MIGHGAKHPAGTVGYKVGKKTYWRRPGMEVAGYSNGTPVFRRKASTYHGLPGVHARGRSRIPAAAARDAWGGRFTHR